MKRRLERDSSTAGHSTLLLARLWGSSCYPARAARGRGLGWRVGSLLDYREEGGGQTPYQMTGRQVVDCGGCEGIRSKESRRWREGHEADGVPLGDGVAAAERRRGAQQSIRTGKVVVEVGCLGRDWRARSYGGDEIGGLLLVTWWEVAACLG